jgi:succinyl-CoA:acetate CoA-transferase
MSNIEYKRIRNKRLINRVVDPSLAAKAVEDGMVIATGGGPVFGYPKSFFSALAERGKTERIKTDLWSASLLGEEVDGALSASGVIRKRLGSVGTSSIRRLINDKLEQISKSRTENTHRIERAKMLLQYAKGKNSFCHCPSAFDQSTKGRTLH